MHGGTVETDPVAGQSQRGRHRGQPAAAVPILQVGEQKWHRCRALLGRLAALRYLPTAKRSKVTVALLSIGLLGNFGTMIIKTRY